MSTPAAISVAHGAMEMVFVTVDAYNTELRDSDGGFIGDRATNRAFRAIVEETRQRIRHVAEDDPLGDTPTEEIPKKEMDKLLVEGEPEAAGVIHGAVEEFASELSTVVMRILKLKAWRDTERIVVGGGLRASRVGELAIGRASVLLKAAGHAVDLVPIHNDPDEAGLIGAIHLAPSWMLEGHDAILAVDIGGSNLRAGVVERRLAKGTKKATEKAAEKATEKAAEKAAEIPRGAVDEMDLWRYVDEKTKPTRDQAVERIGAMLERLIRRAEKRHTKLAPFIGVGCPGVITAGGFVERGAQNLPGNWESSRFNLPELLQRLVPKIDGHDTLVVMHNDAVLHGLGELAYVQDVDRWGVLTIGTGLGNARFTNRRTSA